MKGDAPILGPTREPLIVSCEQCLKNLGLMVGGVAWDEMPSGTFLCFDCVKRLAKWTTSRKGGAA